MKSTHQNRILLANYLFIIQFWFFTPIMAQSPSRSASVDMMQISHLLHTVHQLEDTNTTEAFKLIRQLKTLCAKAGIDTLTAKTYGEEGLCNHYNGNYRRAAQCFDSAALLWKKTSVLNYFKATNNKANALMFNSNYHQALMAFFECLNMEDSIHNKKLTGQVLNNIGLVYESIGDEDNALSYEKKSLVYKLATGDSVTLARTYGNIGNAFAHKGMLDSAIFYEQMSYRLYLPHQDREGMSNALGDIGNMYMKKNDPDSAVLYLSQGLAIAQRLSNAENSANFENDLAQIYLKKGDLPHAWSYASMAAAHAPEITDNEFLQNHYELMYRYFKRTGNTVRAFDYLEKLNTVNDSIFRQKINIQNEKIAFEYEYRQKQLKDSLIYQTQLAIGDKKITATRNRLIISVLLLLLAVLLVIIGYSRSKLLRRQNLLAHQKHALQEQKIKELENERQILASQGVLQGQESERSRLAKDLHDGLGGLLTGAKHSIIHMKETIIIDGDAIAIFEKSLGMIDTAMTELRRVAQNMMPEALAKFGLEEALKDYCASACTRDVKVVFESFGDSLHLDHSRAIFIYRIIQELVNNAVKHAEATQVMVQLVKGEGWITLSVEDNGKGFDVNNLKESTGSGWSNIKSRVGYLNGNLDLRSEKGTGTSVNIEIKTAKS